MQFEKVIKIDPSLDEKQGWEKPINIEKSDEEYFHKKPSEKERETIEHTHQINLREKNEKSKSKTPKRKPKKDDPKLLRTAVENI